MNYGYYKKGYSVEENSDTYYDVYCYVPYDERIFHDNIGSSRNLSYLLNYMGEGDNLYIANVIDLGRDFYKVVMTLAILKRKKIRLFIMSDEVNIDNLLFSLVDKKVAE